MMLKKIAMISIIFLLASCAGIRFCNKDESPRTGCHKWDPASTAGAAAR